MLADGVENMETGRVKGKFLRQRKETKYQFAVQFLSATKMKLNSTSFLTPLNYGCITLSNEYLHVLFSTRFFFDSLAP
jgi:hypothetical protein